MTKLQWIETIIVVISFLMITIYHLYFLKVLRENPRKTAFGLTTIVRKLWVRAIMHRELDVVAIQTMRNWIMAASFLASTSILLSLAMLHVAFSAPPSIEIIHISSFPAFPSDMMWKIKWLAVATNVFFAFFCFTMTIRHYNHASILIELPLNADETVTTENVAAVINRGALFNLFGMRGFYLTVPFILWMFSPILMLIGTIGVVGMLYKLDRTV